jgi:16S rRNA (adenine1518-N6/adenine1519-N6)-dimethyltransferase
VSEPRKPPGKQPGYHPPWRERRRPATGPTAEIKATLERFGLRPQKGFGQNFLRDERYLQRIVQAADLQPTDVVLEVGPGLGALTRELASRAQRVVAVEIDRGMAEALKPVLAAYPDATVVNADVLDVDPAELVGGGPYKVVANLPFYITSPILRHFLEGTRAHPTRMVVMVQREVAERMVARPPEMSLLSVSVQLYGLPRVVTFVPAQAFYPPPKVASAVVRIDVYPRPAVDCEPEKLFKVVQAGFSQPRKQLHNAIAQRLWLPKDAAPKLLEEAGVDPMRRAQTLSLEEWGRICRLFSERGYL